MTDDLPDAMTDESTDAECIPCKQARLAAEKAAAAAAAFPFGGGGSAAASSSSSSVSVAASGASSGVARTNANLLLDAGLEPAQAELCRRVFAHFRAEIFCHTPLVTGSTEVLVWGVSEATSDLRDYGVTYLYLGKMDCDQHDYFEGDADRFVEVWKAEAKTIGTATRARILVVLNLSAHDTAEALFTTLLHEWFIHGVHWRGVIEDIRSGKGAAAVSAVKAQGWEQRATIEHEAYARCDDALINDMVATLSLPRTKARQVAGHLRADRKAHEPKKGRVR